MNNLSAASSSLDVAKASNNVVSPPPAPKPDDDLKEIILGSAGVMTGLTMIQHSSSILLTGAQCLLIPEPALSTAGGIALISAGSLIGLAGGGVVVISIALALGRGAIVGIKDHLNIEAEPVKEPASDQSETEH